MHSASDFRQSPIFRASFHTIVTSRASYYAPPDTGVSDLQLVAVEQLPPIEGTVEIRMGVIFLRGRFYLQAPKPSPMRGRWHGGAVTDEVEVLASTRRSPPHQSPPATASPHRGSHGSAAAGKQPLSLGCAEPAPLEGEPRGSVLPEILRIRQRPLSQHP